MCLHLVLTISEIYIDVPGAHFVQEVEQGLSILSLILNSSDSQGFAITMEV